MGLNNQNLQIYSLAGAGERITDQIGRGQHIALHKASPGI
jgi:hypothetical protein